MIEEAKVRRRAPRDAATGRRSGPGQAGRRIVDEAKEIHARAIVMPLPPRPAAASLFSKRSETVLAERPCRVIIESMPDRWPRASGRAA